jgi:hypothetical protein
MSKQENTPLTADQILAQAEDSNEYHFHWLEREWLIECMETFAAQRVVEELEEIKNGGTLAAVHEYIDNKILKETVTILERVIDKQTNALDSIVDTIANLKDRKEKL